jgi:hypothetical protein
MLVVPATWDAEAGGSSEPMFKTSLGNTDTPPHQSQKTTKEQHSPPSTTPHYHHTHTHTHTIVIWDKY